MATLKLSIDSRRIYSDGRMPIIFRLSSNQQSTSIESGIKVLPKEWDATKSKVTKTHSDFKDINLHLNKRLLELENRLLKHSSLVDEISVAELKKLLLNKQEVGKTKLLEFGLKEIESMRNQGKYGNAQSYETALNRFIKYTGNNITLDKVNYTVISDFDAHLIKEGLTRNSVAVYMRELRALLNKAINKNLMDKNTYPFSRYKIKTEKTINRAIGSAELIALKSMELIEGTIEWHSRNIFFLIFNLIGISFIDLALLKQENIQKDRIVYRRRKTGKIYSIKITDEAQRIFSLYKSRESTFLISYFGLDGIPKSEERLIVQLRLKTCNKYLKRLGKELEFDIPLTTYVARYSWANIAKSMGYSKDLIAESLGHEYGNRITGIYLDNYGNEVIDEMNEKVQIFRC